MQYFPVNQENQEINHNVNIAIASAITSYARIHMSQFKNNPKINLYYTDTDSIYTDSVLDPVFIDNKELGKLKLEHVCNKAIFLSAKVYCLETEDGQIIYKVKGLSHKIELTMENFESLLYKNTFLQKFQTKWVKNLSEGHIKVNFNKILFKETIIVIILENIELLESSLLFL